jgi:dsDNA-binding SOS-regulon protein
MGRLRRALKPPRFREHAERETPTRRENVTYISGALGGAVALLALIHALVSLFSPGTAHDPKRYVEAGRVSVAEAFVRNGLEESHVEADARLVQNRETAPTIEILLRNASRRDVLITAASVTIEAYAQIRLCFAQGGGDVPEAPAHTVILPAFPTSSERYGRVRLGEEVSPDSNLLIPIVFDSRTRELGVYKLHLQLWLAGSPQPLNAGSFLLSTPGAIPPQDTYFPLDNSFFPQFLHGSFKDAWFEVTWCLRQNLAAMRLILAGGAARASQLEVLTHPLLASQWPAAQDHTPAAASALRLLHEKREPVTAVFAAQATGDPHFQSKIRTDAADLLLSSAEQDLRETQGAPLQAEQQIREALSLQSSSRATALLAAAKRRVSLAGQAPEQW